MKKKFFTILTIVLGTMFMTSCGGGDDKEYDTVTNGKILALMQKNYLWALPASPNVNQETPAFFGSLLNASDRYTDEALTLTYSRISPANAGGTVYDPGFEYAINNYVASNVTYYVVLYVKPNTPVAADQVLSRGMYITTVNDVAVTKANAPTLLYNAYKDGKDVRLKIRTPMITKEEPAQFKPVAGYVEAPMLTSTILTGGALGAKKVGYVMYNNFSQGPNGSYDASLANKLTEFKTQGVTTLVFDVRYNSSGNIFAIQALGSALVKNRDVNKAFIQQIFRQGLPAQPLNFRATTTAGTAIPTLGDNLEKIYIITGKTTAGAPEALINALNEYRKTDIVLVGEATKGRTVATAQANENTTKENPTASGNWSMRIALNYLADAKGNYNYSNGFTPNRVIKEVEEAATQKILLGELGVATGDNKEIVLSQVVEMIAGLRSASAPMEMRSSASNEEVQTSLWRRPGSNETTVDLY